MQRIAAVESPGEEKLGPIIKCKTLLSTRRCLIDALQVSADSLLRPNTPGATSLYENEFSEILNDCTPSQMDSILKIVWELKQTMCKKEESH
ncbi:hypothetical protein [Oscillibacter sp.]|uniref:hypothetical protein n=1 Tax=Oscillibacter sp. TaxID=1945593 RepID=UPI00289D71F5|nr:hypothetical protein [Oscillibacter sp.]